MMDKEVITKWADALESDKYPQTTGLLRTEEGYCCLGVFCDIFHPEGWREVPPIDEDDVTFYSFEYKGESEDEILEPRFREAYGMDKSIHDKGMEMNDNGFSFKEIAQWLRSLIKEDDHTSREG